ncbi:hypothetical protein EVAR_92046_1 [Eumeta japonica]|uniref:Uncharacterized protein n=1 Tax=Eumeta variegata TaxID=151549 RepID=A0A4C1SY02_EUMVA|nr:hypothetical protein EVAR_92046_1 [Eumeta japonica]
MWEISAVNYNSFRSECLKEATECDIIIEGEKVEQAKDFEYLGSLFTNDGKHKIYRRVNKRNKVNGVLLAVINSKSVSLQARLVIHSEILILTSTYGSDAGYGRRKIKEGSMQYRCDRCVIREECLGKIDIETVMLERGVV